MSFAFTYARGVQRDDTTWLGLGWQENERDENKVKVRKANIKSKVGRRHDEDSYLKQNDEWQQCNVSTS